MIVGVILLVGVDVGVIVGVTLFEGDGLITGGIGDDDGDNDIVGVVEGVTLLLGVGVGVTDGVTHTHSVIGYQLASK